MDKEVKEQGIPMGKDIQVIKVKKSDLRANTFFDYKYITRDEPGFVPCRFQEEDEEVTFIYTMTGLIPLKEIKKELMVNRYRLLLNVKELEALFARYSFYLTEGNIYYDRNLVPHILVRDILVMEAMTQEENEQRFFQQYQKLAAGVVSNKFTCRQVQESGLEVLQKEKSVAPMLKAGSMAELFDELQKSYDQTAAVIKNSKLLVDKKSHRIAQIACISIIVLLFLGIVYTGFQVLYVMPLEKSVIRASKSYITQDYSGCVEDLTEVPVDRMDTYTKYILAVSYAKCEMLKKEELNNIVEKLSIYSNEIELDYWIYLGRYEVAMAENIAKALSDDKLLIYSYMKEINLLENNITMDGAEKQSRLTELSQEITNLGKKYLEQE